MVYPKSGIPLFLAEKWYTPGIPPNFFRAYGAKEQSKIPKKIRAYGAQKQSKTPPIFRAYGAINLKLLTDYNLKCLF